jgi:hypothetical protein
MHNWTDAGATTIVCDTATSTPTPPFHCKTDGCISTSTPDTWLALDYTQRNETYPPTCNSNSSWHDHCYYTSAATGIAVAQAGRQLLVAHAAENPPCIRVFDKAGGRLLASMPIAATSLAMAPDDKSFWAMLFDHPQGRIARYTTTLNGDDEPGTSPSVQPPPVELAVVAGLDTACAIAVHPATSALWVTDRKTQQFLVFPAAGGGARSGAGWGASLKLSFPYLPDHSGGELADMVCATIAFTATGEEAWITDPGNRRILKVDVGTEAVLDQIMFLTVQ